jgi:hypothetical protein
LRSARLVIPLLFLAGLACRSAKSVPEPGAVLLKVKCPADAPTPDELRVWVYDDGGRLWDGVRIPAQGPLVVANPRELGTILIVPGVMRGKLRIHLSGLAAGARVLDGILTVDSLSAGDRTYDILLTAELPVDADMDGVPDLIDDCPTAANPVQGGCPAPVVPDAGIDEVTPLDAPAELPPATLDGRPGADAEDAADAAVLLGPDAAEEGDAPIGGDDAVTSVDEGWPDAPAESDLGLPGIEAGPGMDAAKVDTLAAPLDAGSDGGLAADLDSASAPDTLPDAADGAGGCVDGGECDKPQGALCTTDAECASGACADGVCCTNACQGPCRSCNQPTATGICQGYASGADPELECQSGRTCNGVGACGPVPPPNLPNGQLCTSPSQCLSGFCKDGVCCDTACTTACMACGSGACQAIKRTDDVPECAGTMTCNSKGSCVAR